MIQRALSRLLFWIPIYRSHIIPYSALNSYYNISSDKATVKFIVSRLETIPRLSGHWEKSLRPNNGTAFYTGRVVSENIFWSSNFKYQITFTIYINTNIFVCLMNIIIRLILNVLTSRKNFRQSLKKQKPVYHLINELNSMLYHISSNRSVEDVE